MRRVGFQTTNTPKKKEEEEEGETLFVAGQSICAPTHPQSPPHFTSSSSSSLPSVFGVCFALKMMSEHFLLFPRLLWPVAGPDGQLW